jgi:hypothetical protein
VSDPDAVVVESASDDAFGELFAAHYSDLLRYAIRRVGTDEAPDVVSDVFLVAWRRRGERVPLHRARRHLADALGRSSGPSEQAVSR